MPDIFEEEFGEALLPRKLQSRNLDRESPVGARRAAASVAGMLWSAPLKK